MGYCTKFKIKAIYPPSEGPEYLSDLSIDAAYIEHDEFEEHNDCFFLDMEEPTKWYDCHEDMVELSKKYPKAVFIMDGEGEEQGDVWRTFFFDGKHYSWQAPDPCEERDAQVFDPLKLK